MIFTKESMSSNTSAVAKRSFAKGLSVVFVLFVVSVAVVVVYISNNNALPDSVASADVNNHDDRDDKSSKYNSNRRLSGLERLLVSEESEDDLVNKIAKKLEPTIIRTVDYDDEKGEVETIVARKKGDRDNNDRKFGDHKKIEMVPHQFLHLHHMKTGGTSIDHLLRCSMNRLKNGDGDANHTGSVYDVPYYSIHECSRSRFAKCLTDKENSCRASMDKAAVMSYCGALKYLDEFGWWENRNADQKITAFTILRNPIDRVWSMFRFQTKNCYKCTPLKDVYKAIDDGTVKEKYGLDKLCLDQIQNHEVANLLSSEWPMEVTELKNGDEGHQKVSDAMIQEAITNMKQYFTVIGITEELVSTASILGEVIPWMNETIGTISKTENKDGERRSLSWGSTPSSSTATCSLPHANTSPKNNRCGEKNTHWDLPNKPDQETHDLILKHNQMDIELYNAAVAYFALQQRALGKI